MKLAALFLTAAMAALTSGAHAGPTSTQNCLRGHSSNAHCRQMLANYWQHEQAITAIALHNGLEPALLKALVAVESQFNAKAKSPKNARGLMQVLPSTARDIGLQAPEETLFQPELALATGAAYLRQLWFQFRDWELALAAYNAGPGAVRKHGGIPPYKQTRDYVPAVLSLYREFALADALTTQH